MLSSQALLLGILLPATVAGICALLAWKRSGTAPASNGYVGVAIAGGYAIGHSGALGLPEFPPGEATDWLVYIALAALVPVALDVWAAPPAWLRWGLRGGLIAGSCGVMLLPLIEHSWNTNEVFAWLAGLTLVGTGYLWVAETSLPRLAAPAAWIVLMLSGSGAALSLALSGSLALGQLGGALSACLGGTLAAALLARSPGATAVTLPVPATILGGLLLCGYFYSELPGTAAVLLLAAPLVSRVTGSFVERRSPATSATVSALAGTAVVAAAVAWTIWTAAPSEPYY